MFGIGGLSLVFGFFWGGEWIGGLSLVCCVWSRDRGDVARGMCLFGLVVCLV